MASTKDYIVRILVPITLITYTLIFTACSSDYKTTSENSTQEVEGAMVVETEAPIHTHSYSLISSTTGPDCYTPGEDTYKCSCGNSYTKANNSYGPYTTETYNCPESVVHPDKPRTTPPTTTTTKYHCLECGCKGSKAELMKHLTDTETEHFFYGFYEYEDLDPTTTTIDLDRYRVNNGTIAK